jgi:hypothetical protein
MKTKSFVLLPLFGAALLLSACSTISSRINEKSTVFNSLDPATQAQIQHGDIGIGFTPDMVYMALGKPDAKRYRRTADGTAETWIYSTYYDYYDGFAYAGYHRWGGWGPRGFYRMYWGPVYPPAYSPLSNDDIRVTFRNGTVASIDQAHA